MTFTAYVYKLCSNETNISDIYIGSTRNFRQRKCGHKQICNNSSNEHHNVYVYQFIRNNGGWSNWSMISLYSGEFENKKELEQKEREFIETFESALNCKIPTRTKKEYYEDNKEQLLEKKKQYYENNKEQLLEKKKQYYENNKEETLITNKKYRDNNKEKLAIISKKYRSENKDDLKNKKKQYYENNKEAIENKKKQYYENNKEKASSRAKRYRDNNKESLKEKNKQYREETKEKRNEKIICECGSIITRQSKHGHLKSKKHVEFHTD